MRWLRYMRWALGLRGNRCPYCDGPLEKDSLVFFLRHCPNPACYWNRE